MRSYRMPEVPPEVQKKSKQEKEIPRRVLRAAVLNLRESLDLKKRVYRREKKQECRV